MSRPNIKATGMLGKLLSIVYVSKHVDWPEIALESR